MVGLGDKCAGLWSFRWVGRQILAFEPVSSQSERDANWERDGAAAFCESHLFEGRGAACEVGLYPDR